MRDDTEKQKMLAGKPFHSRSPELVDDKKKAISFLNKFNLIKNPYEIENELRGFLGSIGNNVKVGRDFDVTYGYNIYIGNNVSINRGCKFLDAGKISIGDFCIIGPCVHFYAASHPTDPHMRKDPVNKDIVIPENICIEENVYIGGNVTILPGIKIGKNSVIGAGSVITKNIPNNVIAAGNPAKLIRQL